MDITQKITESASSIQTIISNTNNGLASAYNENPNRYPRKMKIGKGLFASSNASSDQMSLNIVSEGACDSWNDWDDSKFDNFDNSKGSGPEDDD